VFGPTTVRDPPRTAVKAPQPRKGDQASSRPFSPPVQLFDTTQIALDVAMHGTSVRQAAIAQNIANVNTPGYRRQDVSFEAQLGAAMAGEDRTAVTSLSPTAAVDPSAAVRADGNSVDIDTEAAGQARNGLQYEALVAVAKARTTIIQTAIGIR